MFWLKPAADPPTSRARHIKWFIGLFIDRCQDVEYHRPILTSKRGPRSSFGTRLSLVTLSAFRSIQILSWGQIGDMLAHRSALQDALT